MIGMSHAGVSRLRSGDREPSLATMITVAEKFGWDLTAQAFSRVRSSWHAEFERVLVKRFGAQVDEPTSA